jgi:hypothetical protein
MGQILLPRKLAQDKTLFGRLYVFVWRKVIGHHHDPLGIEYLERRSIFGKLFELPDRDGGGDVVAQHNVHIHLGELSGLDCVEPGMGRQYLLS